MTNKTVAPLLRRSGFQRRLTRSVRHTFTSMFLVHSCPLKPSPQVIAILPALDARMPACSTLLREFTDRASQGKRHGRGKTSQELDLIHSYGIAEGISQAVQQCAGQFHQVGFCR